MKKISPWWLALLGVGGYLVYRATRGTPPAASSPCPPGQAWSSSYDPDREMYSGSCKPIT